MLVIADTSIWIEFFKANEPYYTQLMQLIENRTIRAIQPIFGELYQGVLSEKEKAFIDNFWKVIFKLEDQDLMINAGRFSHKHKLVSKGITLIGASIIYSVYENECKIWTLDKKMLSFLNSKYIFSP